MAALTNPPEPLALMFADDGSIPNNPCLPLLIFRRAIDLSDTSDPALMIEKIFARHGWGNAWHDGIYPFVHYHSMIHEVLGIANGQAKVRFGGTAGQVHEIAAGDVAVLPAGTGHQCLWASSDLCVIGAYPKTGSYDLCRGSKAEHVKALASIPRVPLPDSDPVHGQYGALIRLWRSP
jgi:uncharacterized protein YjlB